MPYASIADLPVSVRDNVPRHAQEICQQAFNSAWDDDRGREETAHRVAWSAVKRQYSKDAASGKWHAAS